MTRSRLRALPAVFAVLALTVSGCSLMGEDVQVRAQDEVKQQVEQLAEAARVAAGSTAFPQANTNLNNCEGGAGESSDDYSVYYVQGIYQASVPADRQLAALAQVRQAWENAGYTITQDRTFPDGNRGEVAATSPDGFDFSLFSGNVPAMLLLVGSPCYAQPLTNAGLGDCRSPESR